MAVADVAAAGYSRHVVCTRFRNIFQEPGHPPQEADHRGKFLARVFGIFSENIVRRWSASTGAPYENIGRPTVRFDDDDEATRPPTLDFTLRNKASKKTYVAEMKCEIEYEKFKYFILTSPEQLDHHIRREARVSVIPPRRTRTQRSESDRS